MNTSETLLPCPFCGGTDLTHEPARPWHFVQCNNKKCDGCSNSEQWNTRAVPSPVVDVDVAECFSILRKHIGYDYLNNKQRENIEAAHGYLQIIENAFKSIATIPDGWQPIETSPKDGQDLLLFYYGHYAVCYWNGYDWISSIQSNSDEYAPLIMDKATHWQPLPAAPKPTGDV